MGSDLHKVKEYVEYILKNYPETRNSDKLLQVILLSKFYNIDISKILQPDIPSLESIRRCRQKLQAEGKYKSNSRTKLARQELEETYRQFAVTKE